MNLWPKKKSLELRIKLACFESTRYIVWKWLTRLLPSPCIDEPSILVDEPPLSRKDSRSSPIADFQTIITPGFIRGAWWHFHTYFQSWQRILLKLKMFHKKQEWTNNLRLLGWPDVQWIWLYLCKHSEDKERKMNWK